MSAFTDVANRLLSVGTQFEAILCNPADELQVLTEIAEMSILLYTDVDMMRDHILMGSHEEIKKIVHQLVGERQKRVETAL